MSFDNTFNAFVTKYNKKKLRTTCFLKAYHAYQHVKRNGMLMPQTLQRIDDKRIISLKRKEWGKTSEK